jgi:hypothetical protein
VKSETWTISELNNLNAFNHSEQELYSMPVDDLDEAFGIFEEDELKSDMPGLGFQKTKMDISHSLRLCFILALMMAAFLPMAACCSTGDCWVADQIVMMETGVKLGEKNYSLVRRISGFQEKIISYELFEGLPVFDNCGVTGRDPVAYESYDPGQGLVKGLVLKNGRLKIVYTRNPVEEVSVDKLKLVVK